MVVLISNGQLLIRHPDATHAVRTAQTALSAPAHLADYRLEPLFPGGRLAAFAAASSSVGPVWSLAKPTSMVQQNPWDTAHHVAAQQGYIAYVEPDILNSIAMAPPAAVAPVDLIKDYPPRAGVSPGWHLGLDFTGFESIRGLARGQGVRIAHLDTGYTPGHDSTPRHIYPHMGWNFWDDNDNTVDPGTQFAGILQPGHGTATLAILAGNTINLNFRNFNYTGDFGGAPDAEVIPVRIGASVVHLASSTMARGLNYALAPRNDPGWRCNVVSLSQGGLPSASWATAVNALYDAGVTIVAASGDCYYEGIANVATRFTVYPSAFNRVVTALGATYGHRRYMTGHLNVMQGCWGPDAVMEKAIAAFTPNVAWMNRRVLPAGFDMTGAGTSASTPQIAAACALWLQLYGARFPTDWRLVEACRLALFKSGNFIEGQRKLLGWGTLNVPKMLDPKLVDAIEAEYNAGNLRKSAEDEVSFPFWRLLVGVAPPGSVEEAMYEAEAAQIVLSTSNPALLAAAQRVGNGGTLSAKDQTDAITALLSEPVSAPLAARLRRG